MIEMVTTLSACSSIPFKSAKSAQDSDLSNFIFVGMAAGGEV